MRGVSPASRRAGIGTLRTWTENRENRGPGWIWLYLRELSKLGFGEIPRRASLPNMGYYAIENGDRGSCVRDVRLKGIHEDYTTMPNPSRSIGCRVSRVERGAQPMIIDEPLYFLSNARSIQVLGWNPPYLTRTL